MDANQRLENIDMRLDRLLAAITVLTDQVGRLTEGLTEFRADMAELKETTKQQADTTAKLVGIVEALIQERTQN